MEEPSDNATQNSELEAANQNQHTSNQITVTKEGTKSSESADKFGASQLETRVASPNLASKSDTGPDLACKSNGNSRPDPASRSDSTSKQVANLDLSAKSDLATGLEPPVDEPHRSMDSNIRTDCGGYRSDLADNDVPSITTTRPNTLIHQSQPTSLMNSDIRQSSVLKQALPSGLEAARKSASVFLKQTARADPSSKDSAANLMSETACGVKKERTKKPDFNPLDDFLMLRTVPMKREAVQTSPKKPSKITSKMV